MLKTYLAFVAALMCAITGAKAQVVTTSPDPIKEDSENVVLYFHADQGNKALANLPSTTAVYAHIGAITTKSSSDSDWKYGPSKWCDNAEKYQLKYEEENLYSLNMGNIREYFGITNDSEIVKKIAVVFRNATGTKQTDDIFINVIASGLQIELSCDLDGTVVTSETGPVTFTLTATIPADLEIKINNVTVAAKENTTELSVPYTFTEVGNYTIDAYGKAGDASRVTFMSLAYVDASPKADYPGGVPVMGPVANADGSVTFCIAAPGKSQVMMVNNLNDFTPSDEYMMKYQDYEGFRYFWITIPNIDRTKPFLYYYLIDTSIKVGDPYARLSLEPSNDKYISEEVFPNMPTVPASLTSVPVAVYWPSLFDYTWKVTDFEAPAHSDLLIYELLFRDFTGTEGKANGNGTVRQAMEKLPYLKQLGINAIEVLPINEFNGNNSWGYNPNFYFAPDKAYGTPADYKEFVDKCHEMGIAVIVDVVFNQSDWLNPWYRMYPVGSNPFYNATAPHAYSVLNDWNQGYPLVKQQWNDVVKYWLEEFNVDGFRFDLVKGLGDNDSYPNPDDNGTNAYNASRVANMRAIQQAMDEVKPGAIFINENLAGSKEENEMAETGQLNWANINSSGIQYAKGSSSSASFTRFSAEKDGRLWGSTVSYLESHDEQRLAYEQNTYGVTGVKGNLEVSMRRLGSAAAQMILTPGAHMIWQFSELGNDQSTKASNGDNNTSPKKVLWSYFDVPERQGLYWDYAKCASIRRRNPELYTQEAEMAMNFSAWGQGRYLRLTNGDKEIILAVNPNVNKDADITVKFTFSNQDNYELLGCTSGTSASFDVAAGTISVPANSFAVIGTRNTSGVDTIAADGGNSALKTGEKWYTVTGAPVATPEKGLYICVETYSDGSTKARKVML